MSKLYFYLPARSLFVAASLLSIGCGPTPSNAPVNSNVSTPGPSPTAFTCSAAQNRAIIAYINDAINNDTDLSPIKRNINWHTDNCRVYLVGWTGKIQSFKKLEKYAMNAPAFASFDNDYLWVDRGDAKIPDETSACADGWSKCGDICIPPGQTCYNELKTVADPKP